MCMAGLEDNQAVAGSCLVPHCYSRLPHNFVYLASGYQKVLTRIQMQMEGSEMKARNFM